MKKLLLVITAIALTLNLTGCAVINLGNTGAIVYGEGELQTYSFDVAKFNKLEIVNDFEVIYRNGESGDGETYTITIEMQENLYEYVGLGTTPNGTLSIESSGRLRIGNGVNDYPKVTITAPELQKIEFKGAGTLTNFEPDSDKIVTDELELKISGMASISLSIEVETLNVHESGAASLMLRGTADTANWNISGAVNVTAIELDTRDTVFEMSGAGSAVVACSENLNVTISGAGSLRYRGEPQLEQKISGVGTVSKVQ